MHRAGAALGVEAVAMSKRFGELLALDEVSLRVAPGSFHALLGENGAGKSTLMAIAYGMQQPDEGIVQRDGAPVRFRSPLDARAAGIGMVHQHSTAIAALTVAENVALAAGWPVSRPAALHARVAELAERSGLPLDPRARVEDLNVALRQRLEIIKALASDARILLLDEPAAVLAPTEAEELLRIVRTFCERGGSAVLITHKLEEALAHADDVTVLRRGRLIVTGAANAFTRAQVAQAMIGDEGAAALEAALQAGAQTSGGATSTPRDSSAARDTAGSIADADTHAVQAHPVLAMQGAARGRLRPATLEVRAGEIVGVAAVEGNGQHELLRMAAGLIGAESGTITRNGAAALVPEDRTHEALIGEFSLTENVVLGAPTLGGVDAGWRLGARVRWEDARTNTGTLMSKFDVRADGADAPARSLSGGNQQKLVLGRALATQPALLVVEQPTRGLDFAATAAMHAAIRRAAADGAAVLVHAGDLDEVCALATRLIVVHDGVVREVPAGADRATVGRLMLGQAD